MTIQDTIPVYPTKNGLPLSKEWYMKGHTIYITVTKDYFMVSGTPQAGTGDRYYFRIKLKQKP